MTDHPLKPWDSELQQLAEQASKETDPEKVSQLIRLLCDRLDEMDRIRKGPREVPEAKP
jgi:hypothetical protein